METEESIQAMMERFDKLREKLPRYSAFGDDNHAKIDGGIEALQWVLEDIEPPVTDEDLK